MAHERNPESILVAGAGAKKKKQKKKQKEFLGPAIMQTGGSSKSFGNLEPVKPNKNRHRLA